MEHVPMAGTAIDAGVAAKARNGLRFKLQRVHVEHVPMVGTAIDAGTASPAASAISGRRP